MPYQNTRKDSLLTAFIYILLLGAAGLFFFQRSAEALELGEPASSLANKIVSRVYGSAGGISFTDRVRSDEQVVRIRITYDSAIRSVRTATNRRILPRRGTPGRRQAVIVFAPGEYLLSVRGRYAQTLRELTLITNVRTYGPYGGGRVSSSKPGSQAFRFNVPAGYEIAGFTGRAGSYINAIGVIKRQRTGDAAGNPALAALELAPISSPPQTVNVPVNYTAVANGNTQPLFSWVFGDGTAATAQQSSPSISHAFTAPGRYNVIVTATDSNGVVATRHFVQAVHLPLTAVAPRVSQSITVEPGNGRLWNVNPDNDSVTVTDPQTGTHTEIGVGIEPRSLAFAPDGRLWVANHKSATLSLIAPDTLAVVQSISLPQASRPFGLLFDPQGTHAYVALEGLGIVLQLDPGTGSEASRIAVSATPRHLAITGDGSQLLVSRFITPLMPGESTARPGKLAADGSPVGGEVRVVATAPALSVSKVIILNYSEAQDTPLSARGLPNYLGPAVIAPDGQSAWIPSKQDNIERGLLRDGMGLTFETAVRGIGSRIDLTSLTETRTDRVDFDNSGIGSTALYHPSSNYLFVALEATREVSIVDAYNHQELARISTGRAPQGLALSEDGLKLYVHNFMDRNVTSHDLSTFIGGTTYEVGTLATYSTVSQEKLDAQVFRGKQLFYDAKDPRLAQDGYLSCAVCHNEGGHDGRVWDFTGFGEGLRNTISLQGHAGTGQGRLHWTANFDEVQDFEGQIRNFARGSGLMDSQLFNTGSRKSPLGDPKAGLSADLDALAAYVTSLESFPASPYRQADGTLTTLAQTGATLFIDLQCNSCHRGASLTDSVLNFDLFHDIGTTNAASGMRLNQPLTGFDTPTLRGTWATAPYLHDGSAPTLADAIAAHTLTGTSPTPDEVSKLSAFLEQLDDSTPY